MDLRRINLFFSWLELRFHQYQQAVFSAIQSWTDRVVSACCLVYSHIYDVIRVLFRWKRKDLLTKVKSSRSMQLDLDNDPYYQTALAWNRLNDKSEIIQFDGKASRRLSCPPKVVFHSRKSVEVRANQPKLKWSRRASL